ncbi:MAG: hypothetical protein ACR2RF_15875 [Geminicoccaceae bacterium]
MGALSSLASVGLNLALADQAQRRQSRTINAERDQQVDAIERRNAEEQRKIEDRLRRQLASQRARAGAAGIGGSASSNAILRGLVEEASVIDQARQQEASQSVATINSNARNARRNNLLELANNSARRGISLIRRGSRSSLLDL